MDSIIAKLYQSPKTILTTNDLALIWAENNADNLKAKISYYAKRGALNRLTRGVFAKSKNYEPKELATSIYLPSYISFETVLREDGIVFQHYDTIFVAAPYSAVKTVGASTITFKRLKEEVLFNPAGIENKGTFSIASKERAFLDTLYLSPNYYFDNLSPLDWDKCDTLVELYNNKQLIKRLASYKKQYAT